MNHPPKQKIFAFQLGSPNEHLQARMKRLQEHPDFPLFVEHLSLIGANPSTLAEIIKLGLHEKATLEAIAYEDNENPTHFARYQAASTSEAIFSGAKGYSVEPSPHLINI